jgi:diacylglycerol kinase (ATP)
VIDPAPPPTPPYPARRGTSFLGSFVHAWNGLVHTVVHQRNMRVHLVSAVLVGLVGVGMPLGLAEKVTLIFCVMNVFFAEILNTALEQLVDLAIQQFDEKARVVKDAAAAGVLVLAIGTVVIFAAILVYNRVFIVEHVTEIGFRMVLGFAMAGCIWLLVIPRPPSRLVDGILFGGVCVLYAPSIPGSYSVVFSALTFGLALLALAAARQRRRGDS